MRTIDSSLLLKMRRIIQASGPRRVTPLTAGCPTRVPSGMCHLFCATFHHVSCKGFASLIFECPLVYPILTFFGLLVHETMIFRFIVRFHPRYAAVISKLLDGQQIPNKFPITAYIRCATCIHMHSIKLSIISTVFSCQKLYIHVF